MGESTALEALIGEMLKDVLRLHRGVEELKAELPDILKQIHTVIANLDAKANAPQQTAQRELERYIRSEIKGISVAVNQVQKAALDRLSAEIFAAVNTGWASAQAKADKTFVEATKRFNLALDESVKVVEARATQTLKGICLDLKNQIDEFSLMRSRNTLLSMIGASATTGALVGVATIYIFK